LNTHIFMKESTTQILMPLLFRCIQGDSCDDRSPFSRATYPSCDSYIGAHKKSMRPMGTMADSNLRNKRIEAHRALDAIWKNGYMTKHSTYIWLQNRLNLREKDTHIGKFSYYLCEQTIRECTDYIKSREEKKKSPDKISVA